MYYQHLINRSYMLLQFISVNKALQHSTQIKQNKAKQISFKIKMI